MTLLMIASLLLSNVETALIWMYGLFTIAKLAQSVLHWIERAKNKNKKQRIAYNSSLRAASFMIDLLAQNEVSNIPRKEYQVITDPLLEQYTKNYATNKEGRKVFTSLADAQESFFYEFTGLQQYPSGTVDRRGKITWFLCHSICHFATKQLALPLGLVWCLIAIPWFSLSAIALVYQKFHVMKWAIHVAIAVTIVDVYVVCCKYDLTFDEGVRKFKWLDLFTGQQQVHPLIGTHICPMYQRKITFRPDVMDFDFVVREHRNSMPTLHQLEDRSKQQSSSASSWSKIIVFLIISLVLLLGYVVLLMINGQEENNDYNLLLRTASSALWNSLVKVAPSAILFYSVRYTVDSVVGTQWDEPWTL